MVVDVEWVIIVGLIFMLGMFTLGFLVGYGWAQLKNIEDYYKKKFNK